LELNRTTHKFEVIQTAARTVRRIFELSKNGMGNNSIAKLLNREKVPGIGRTDSWHASVVARILKSRAVLGEFQPCIYTDRKKRVPDGAPIPNYFPHIIDERTFNVVQHRQSQRRVAGAGRRGKILRNLFSHVAKCGWCGAAMIYTQKRSDSLVCDNARRGYKCRYVGYPYPEFEKSFLQYVEEIDLAALLNPANKASSLMEEIEEARGSLARTESELENVATAFAQRGSSVTLLNKLDELEKQKKVGESRLKELVARHADESTPTKKIRELKQLVAKAQDLDSPTANETRIALREAIRSCVETIKVYPCEFIKPRPDLMDWREKRELTANGWSIHSDIQRLLRGFWVYFRNGPESRLVYSHPKAAEFGSEKIVPTPDGKLFDVLSVTKGRVL
jgi:hypothetical protein